MPLGEHLEELRSRLIYCIAGVLPLFVVAFIFGRRILDFLLTPVLAQLRELGQSASLQATGVLETFNTTLYIAFICAIVFGSPWVLYQLWRFIAPGLRSQERRFVYILLPMSATLVVIGVCFLYFIILPLALHFFIHYGTDLGRPPEPTAPLPAEVTLSPLVPVLPYDPPAPPVGSMWINQHLMQLRICMGMNGATPLIRGSELISDAAITQNYRVSEYIKLVLALAMGFGAAFQTPVVVLLLGWAGAIDHAFLRRFRRHAFMACAVAGALLTPGDPMSMIAMTVPLYFLYELGGILLWLMPAERVAHGVFRMRSRKEPSDAGDP